MKSIVRVLLLWLVIAPYEVFGECGRTFANFRTSFIFGGDFVDGDGMRWSAGGNGTVSRTSPEGKTEVISIGSNHDLVSIVFIDKQKGFIGGESGSIFVSTDGGRAWSPQESGVKATLLAVSCSDFARCLAVGEGGIVLRTTDGGQRWKSYEVRGKATLTGVQLTASGQAWAVGRDGLVVKSEDGGVTWEKAKQAMFQTSNYSDLHSTIWKGLKFAGPSLGCLAGHNRITCTSDSGRNWKRWTIDDQKGVFEFVNFVFLTDRIVALEECGRDFESFDEGRNWREVGQ